MDPALETVCMHLKLSLSLQCEKATQSNVFSVSFIHSLKSFLVTPSANPKNPSVYFPL